VLLLVRQFANEPANWTTRALGEAFGLAAVTAVAYGLWDLAMRRGNLLFILAASYFTPLLSTAVSCVYLRVSPSPKLWVGCLLLIGGSLLTWRAVSDAAEARTPIE
jgi:drug/metabolite transporter (DMT)-like permease